MGRRKNWDILNTYNKEELHYFDKQSTKNKDTIIKMEERLIEDDLNNYNIPLRFKFLLSKTTMENKKVMLNKLNELKMTSRCGGESAKLHKMISVLSQIPFGIYHNIKYDNITNYLNNVHTELNNRIYGHTETKNQIIRILAQFIVNPDMANRPTPLATVSLVMLIINHSKNYIWEEQTLQQIVYFTHSRVSNTAYSCKTSSRKLRN